MEHKEQADNTDTNKGLAKEGGLGEKADDANEPNPNENKDGKDKSTDRIGNISVGDTDPGKSDRAHLNE